MTKCLVIAAAVLAASATAQTISAGPEAAGQGTLISGSKFGMDIGGAAADAQAALWDAGYGYQGVAACTDATRALFACHAGDTFLRFQPVALDRKGAVYLKLEDGHISAIGWDLKNVPAQEG
jgi:hypothetical protein